MICNKVNVLSHRGNECTFGRPTVETDCHGENLSIWSLGINTDLLEHNKNNNNCLNTDFEGSIWRMSVNKLEYVWHIHHILLIQYISKPRNFLFTSSIIQEILRQERNMVFLHIWIFAIFFSFSSVH